MDTLLKFIIGINTNIWVVINIISFAITIGGLVKIKNIKNIFIKISLYSIMLLIYILIFIITVVSNIFIEVPNVIGLNAENAKQTILESNLLFEFGNESGKTDKISKQIPESGNYLKKDEIVTLYFEEIETTNSISQDSSKQKIKIVLFPPPSDEELEKSISLINEEIIELSEELSNLHVLEEDIIDNDFDPTRNLNYHNLITKMKNISQYCYFINIVKYMQESGYDVVDKMLSDLMNEFFGLPYDEQVNIISKMFVITSYYEYEINEQDNLHTETHKISIPIFICKELNIEPFGLIKRTKSNKDMYYTTSYDY